MTTFADAMAEFERQLDKGILQQAYKGLMDYLLDLKAHFKTQHPESFVSGSLYAGYMDMSYFSFVPESLKARNLKIAIVFNFARFRFEVWLSGYNRQVQAQYWQMIRQSGWDKYRLVADPRQADAIIEHVLADPPDWANLDALTVQIETGTLAFVRDVEQFLAACDG